MNSMFRSSVRWLALAVLLGGAGSPAFGQTTWTNSGTGDWFTAGNWSGGLPTNSLLAIIRNGGTSRITGGAAVAAGVSLGGAPGAGTLEITNGTFSTAGSIQLGTVFGGGHGTLLVSGSSTSVATTGSLLVGDAGVGVMTLADGTVSNAIGFVGAGVGASGTATISGGRWQNTGNLFIGDYGKGVLNISSGTVSNAMGLLGYNSGASGAALISGGLWQSSGEIQVGNFGWGTLAVTAYGGVVHTDSIVRVGVNSGTGSITVTDGGVIEAGQFVEGAGFVRSAIAVESRKPQY